MSVVNEPGPTKPVRLELTTPQDKMVKGGINGNHETSQDTIVRMDRHQNSPGFLVSFMVDARGGSMRGKRHSGVDIVIPPSKVCMPTRITCKLIKKEKVANLPVLKEDEALASRILEVGPVGAKFVGPVLIELPHFASRINGERELVIMRSDSGQSWHEHISLKPTDTFNKMINSNNNEKSHESDDLQRSVLKIFTADFPKYFVAVTRVRQETKLIGSSGGSLQISQAQVVFPQNAVNKETKIGLQILPAVPETILNTKAGDLTMSPIVTIEPRRRKFHLPVSVTIPVPKKIQEGIKTQKKDSDALVRLLYSITAGSSVANWEDITGSAPFSLVKDCVSFNTTVSARYWLIESSHPQELLKEASDIYNEVISVPFLARFYVLAKRHSQTEIQVRILCLTDDDVTKTLEFQEHFALVANSPYVEVVQGKSYYLDMIGNFAPSIASGNQLCIVFYAFRVNRLSFIIRIQDVAHLPSGQLFLNKESFVPVGKTPQSPLCTLDVVFPNFDARLLSPDLEPEKWQSSFETAKQKSASQDELSAGPELKLTDIAETLKGDWVPLAAQLGITSREVVKIQTEYGSTSEQAILMLHLWVEKAGNRAKGSELEAALRRIGREDVIDKCIHNRMKTQTANPEEHESLNPIDLTFMSHDVSHDADNSRDNLERTQAFVGAWDVIYLAPSWNSYLQPVLFEVLVSNCIEDSLGGEVEEGAVYQMEDVWDGTQWHKTRKIIPKMDESITSAVAEDGTVVTTNEIEIEQAIPLTGSHPPLPTDENTATVEEVEQAVTLTDAHPPLQTDENGASVEEVEVSMPNDSSSAKLDDGDLGTSNAVEPIVGLISGIEIGEPVTETEVEEVEDVLPDGTIVKRSITKTKREQKIVQHSIASSALNSNDPAGDVEGEEIPVEGNTVVEEETEETLEDGTVVRRKIIKTNCQQIITS